MGSSPLNPQVIFENELSNLVISAVTRPLLAHIAGALAAANAAIGAGSNNKAAFIKAVVAELQKPAFVAERAQLLPKIEGALTTTLVLMSVHMPRWPVTACPACLPTEPALHGTEYRTCTLVFARP
jgi:hypothetical protein